MTWTLTIIDCSILGAYLYYLLFIWATHPFSVGGTLIFVTIIGINFYLSIIRKEFSKALTDMSLILFSLTGLNLVAYFEYRYGFSASTLMGTSIFALLLIISFLHLINMPLGGRETSQSPPIKVQLRFRFAGLTGYTFLIPLIFIGITGSFFMAVKDRLAGAEYAFNFSIFSVVWIIAGILFVLAKIRLQENIKGYLPYLVVKKLSGDENTFRKWLYGISIFVLLAGSIIELNRHLWILWILTWCLLNLIIILSWKIWKYVFQPDIHNVAAINVGTNVSASNIMNPSFFLKLVGILTVTGFCYALVLIILLDFVEK